MKSFRLIFLVAVVMCGLSVAEAASKKIHYKLYWRVQNGNIVLSSVCDNYGYGSIAYRGCRAQAKHYFKQQCRRYRDKEQQSSGVVQLRYRGKRQRFCLAASEFGAVN